MWTCMDDFSAKFERETEILTAFFMEKTTME